MNRLAFFTSGTRWLVLTVALVLAWLLANRYLLPAPQDAAGESAGASGLIAFLSQSGDGEYAAVEPGLAITFPQDHGAHPAFRQEWWYFTGRLTAENGREFGYQLTFFRFAAEALEITPDSSWSADQTWMAHLAITDVAGQRFLSREDFSRESLGLAGARAEPFSVWVNGWSVQSEPGPRQCNDCFFNRLSADAGEIAIDFEIESMGPPVLQGDAGYSRKTADGRAASYYYSIPAIQTRGTLSFLGESWAVSGETWMDREWSSAVLSPGQSGWDWFSLNLDNGIKLMIFQVREGDRPPFRYVAMLRDDGRVVELDSGAMTLTSDRSWQSPHSGSRYPLAWEAAGASPQGDWSLQVSPAVDDQEVNLAFRYYEGLVQVNGQWQGKKVTGWGYMELTGYPAPAR